MPTHDDLFLILSPVRAEVADEFEAFVTDVIAPAVTAYQPEIMSKVQVWRASEPEQGGGIVTFAIVATGVTSWDDLQLEPAFRSHYGDEGARDALDRFSSFHVDNGTWVQSQTYTDSDGPQYGWQLSPVTAWSPDQER